MLTFNLYLHLCQILLKIQDFLINVIDKQVKGLLVDGKLFVVDVYVWEQNLQLVDKVLARGFHLIPKAIGNVCRLRLDVVEMLRLVNPVEECLDVALGNCSRCYRGVQFRLIN